MQSGFLIMLWITTGRQNLPKWSLQCSTGTVNMCEMQNVTLTADTISEGMQFPATNLMISEGFVPRFDARMARMLTVETKMLLVLKSGVQSFVVREMLTVVILDDNQIEEVALVDGELQFELEWLKLTNNRLTNISFVHRLPKLNYLGLGRNRLEVLELRLFENMSNLTFLSVESNRIKTIDATKVWNCQLYVLELKYNELVEFDMKNWLCNNLTVLYLNNNHFQSFNLLQLATSFPKLLQFYYENNPWNCGRMKSLQEFFWNYKWKVRNNTYEVASCTDNSRVHEIAFKLPQNIDSYEQTRELVWARTEQLLDDYGENTRLQRLQARHGKVSTTLQVASRKIAELEALCGGIRDSLDFFSFFEKKRLDEPVY